MPYDVGKDPYLDPHSGILRNLLGITNQGELETAEAQITAVEVSGLLLTSKSHLEDISWQLLLQFHQQIFREIYDWAGQIRTVEMSKENTSFARMDHIETTGRAIFQQLAKEHYLQSLDLPTFIQRLAHYYSELNVIHPFREGNGRAIRTLLSLLCDELGWYASWDKMDPQENIHASIAAYQGDERPMIRMLTKLIRKKD